MSEGPCGRSCRHGLHRGPHTGFRLRCPSPTPDHAVWRTRAPGCRGHVSPRFPRAIHPRLPPTDQRGSPHPLPTVDDPDIGTHGRVDLRFGVEVGQCALGVTPVELRTSARSSPRSPATSPTPAAPRLPGRQWSVASQSEPLSGTSGSSTGPPGAKRPRRRCRRGAGV